MLKARIITASILAPLLILAVLYLPEIWFAVAWGGVIAICAWEWSDLSGLS
jgi:phosphatidate cytidylyltransferase